jgi:ribosomal protein S12 methylthiotransferase
MSAFLLAKGYKLEEKSDKTDSLLINTCGFIQKAKEESIETIRQAVELKNKGKIKNLIVAGCLVKRYLKELKDFFPQVDQWQGVVDINQKSGLGLNLMPRHIGLLKICEGCLNHCTYCAIPLIKGPLKSLSEKDIISQVKQLDKQGVKEVSIIGQDITAWGKDLGGGKNLAGLLKKILKNTKNIKWFRLIYTHPKHVSDELLDLIAKEPRICKYIDLPIQHINSRILKLMNRGVSKQQIDDLIKKIRAKIPNCVIRTSLIVGFPSETQAEFKELLEFIKKIKFSRLGVFAYSREEGTPSYDFSGQIPEKIKASRLKIIMSQQKKISKKINQEMVGRELEVLVDELDGNTSLARSQYDAHEVDGIIFLPKKGFKPGNFYNVKIIDNLEYDLIAE